jgi:predicted nuclease with RNAse H fold
MGTIIGIGWDVGGWMGGKHGLAVAVCNEKDAQIEWLGTTVFSLPQDGVLTPDFMIKSVLKHPNEKGATDIDNIDITKIIIGIDAPLGFPYTYKKMINGEFIFFNKPMREIENRLAYRDTERYIYEAFGKKPLSGTFDRLGNNSTVAIYYAQMWCRNYGYAIHPITETDDERKVIIEVYPGLVKSNQKGRALSPVLELIPEGVKEGTDEYDAVICALMAIAYGAEGRLSSLPKVVGPFGKWIESAKNEGWIYHLKKKENDR